MDKETKRRVRITVLGILGLVVTIIGISYAAFSANIVGKEVNMVNTGCLKVDMTDKGSINIENAMPETDESGLSGAPYTFSIENTCTVNAYYDTTINVMNTSNLDNISKVKLALEGDSYLAPTMESNLQTGELLDTNITGVAKTYKLDEGYLRVGEKKTFSLRTWIDYDVEAIEGSLENKIIINSRAEDNGAVAYNTSTTAYKAIKGNTIIKKADYGSVAPSSSQTSGVIEIKDDDGITYHYRGNPNNHIVFGTYKTTETISYRDSSGSLKQVTNTSGNNIKWRILSTNNDGSINIIKDDVIGEDTYNNASTKLNSFYTTHLSSLEGYIDTTSKFCNETTDSRGNYLAPIRVNKNNPTVKCVSNNMVTKIGLPTVDDIMFSGGVNNTQNTSFFLYQNIYGFMTGSNQSSSNVFISSPAKSIGTLSKTSSIGIRPVITLAKDIKLEGEGTEANPFYISNRFGSTTLNDEYKKDTIAPIINYARVDERWSNQNKHIEISAKDNSTGSGIAGFIVKTTSAVPDKNDSGWEVATTNRYTTVNSYDNGTYYIFVKDNAGNISEGKQVTISRVDKINPVCTLSIDPSGTLSSYKTLKINTTETNIDLEGYSWKHTKSAEDVIKVSENGVYTATITDLAGNKGQCSAVVTTIKEAEASKMLMSKVGTDGLEVVSHTVDDTLQISSETQVEEYRYSGIKPSNYVIFNDETWRVLGVFPTEDSNGNVSDMVKLIKDTSIGNYEYHDLNDTSTSATASEISSNTPSSLIGGDDDVVVRKIIPEPTEGYDTYWSMPSSLNKFLNGTYFNTFSDENKKYIASVKYYMGGYDYATPSIDKESAWNSERKKSGSSYYGSNTVISWTDKFGLMYASDYGYAVDENCNQPLSKYNDSSCTSNNWLYTGSSDEWLLTHPPTNSYSFCISANGRIDVSYAYSSRLSVRPVFYLNPDVEIDSGSGTSSDPYTLKLSE